MEQIRTHDCGPSCGTQCQSFSYYFTSGNRGIIDIVLSSVVFAHRSLHICCVASPSVSVDVSVDCVSARGILVERGRITSKVAHTEHAVEMKKYTELEARFRSRAMSRRICAEPLRSVSGELFRDKNTGRRSVAQFGLKTR